MKIIFLKDIKGGGKQFEVKEVKEGYARNFLLPKKLAKIATDEEIKSLNDKKATLEKKQAELKIQFEKITKDISGMEFYFYPKIGKKQEVFGSVNKSDIEEAVIKKIPLNLRDEINISANVRTIKDLGEHTVKINFGHGLQTSIKVILNQEKI
ncbi:MAG: 50S ribosomal protein L9 [Patescibacteria group bacterium]|nr:50S ribosomal protein L9 [Patescibacteria group bacterium]